MYTGLLTEQFTGQSLGSTHLLMVVSINWPDGHPQPNSHTARHIRPGLEQVAGQLLHGCSTWPSTGQPTRQKATHIKYTYVCSYSISAHIVLVHNQAIKYNMFKFRTIAYLEYLLGHSHWPECNTELSQQGVQASSSWRDYWRFDQLVLQQHCL